MDRRIIGFIPGIILGMFSSLIFLLLTNHRPVPSPPQTLQEIKPEEESPPTIFTSMRAPQLARYHPVVSHLDFELNDTNSIPHYTAMRKRKKMQPRPIEGGPYLMLVLVFSAANESVLRTAIRQTWLINNHKQKKYVARFVISTAGIDETLTTSLAHENHAYGDLVLLPQVSQYSSSEKLMASFLWAQENVRYMYIFKCTDRTFAHLDPLVHELEERNHNTDLVWGFFSGNTPASTKHEENWFLCISYPTHPHPGGYILNRNLVSMLISLRDTFEYYTHDDIALGVWLSIFDGIERRHDIRFNTDYKSRGCKNAYLVTNTETVQSMYDKYLSHKVTGRSCDKEWYLGNSYEYNWNTSPRSCCKRSRRVPY